MIVNRLSIRVGISVITRKRCMQSPQWNVKCATLNVKMCIIWKRIRRKLTQWMWRLKNRMQNRKVMHINQRERLKLINTWSNRIKLWFVIYAINNWPHEIAHDHTSKWFILKLKTTRAANVEKHFIWRRILATIYDCIPVSLLTNAQCAGKSFALLLCSTIIESNISHIDSNCDRRIIVSFSFLV